jgi:hypothetical protein
VLGCDLGRKRTTYRSDRSTEVPETQELLGRTDQVVRLAGLAAGMRIGYIAQSLARGMKLADKTAVHEAMAVSKQMIREVEEGDCMGKGLQTEARDCTAMILRVAGPDCKAMRRRIGMVALIVEAVRR